MTSPSTTINVFGWEVPEFVLPLYIDSGFTFNLEADPPWPDDITIQFELRTTPDPRDDTDPEIWTATIDGSMASWDVLRTQVNDVLDNKKQHVRLMYLSSDGRQRLYMKGTTRAS